MSTPSAVSCFFDTWATEICNHYHNHNYKDAVKETSNIIDLCFRNIKAAKLQEQQLNDIFPKLQNIFETYFAVAAAAVANTPLNQRRNSATLAALKNHLLEYYPRLMQLQNLLVSTNVIEKFNQLKLLLENFCAYYYTVKQDLETTKQLFALNLNYPYNNYQLDIVKQYCDYWFNKFLPNQGDLTNKPELSEFFATCFALAIEKTYECLCVKKITPKIETILYQHLDDYYQRYMIFQNQITQLEIDPTSPLLPIHCFIESIIRQANTDIAINHAQKDYFQAIQYLFDCLNFHHPLNDPTWEKFMDNVNRIVQYSNASGIQYACQDFIDQFNQSAIPGFKEKSISPIIYTFGTMQQQSGKIAAAIELYNLCLEQPQIDTTIIVKCHEKLAECYAAQNELCFAKTEMQLANNLGFLRKYRGTSFTERLELCDKMTVTQSATNLTPNDSEKKEVKAMSRPNQLYFLATNNCQLQNKTTDDTIAFRKN